MVDRTKAARNLAERAHAGQADKAGRPYIEHVARVAAAVADDPEAEAVAWLHDVLEDCDARYKNELMHDFPVSTFYAVKTLTRYKGVSDRKYYDDIRRDPLALRVKLADIADNSDEARLALLDESTAARLRRKYAKAARQLVQNETPLDAGMRVSAGENVGIVDSIEEAASRAWRESQAHGNR